MFAVLGRPLALGSPCSSRTSPRPSPRAAARPRPRPCAQTRTETTRPTPARRRHRGAGPGTELRLGDLVVVRGRPGHPGRRRRRRGRRHRRRVGDHRRVRTRHPRVRRRPVRRHRRHDGALRPDRRARSRAGRARRFIDRMIALVEGAVAPEDPQRDRADDPAHDADPRSSCSPSATLQPIAIYSGARQSLVVLVALLVCLIPTTIGALLSAIGIAGMDRLVQHNVLAMSGRAVEAAGDVSTLLLDKTGTITFGNRQASEFVPVDRASTATSCAGGLPLLARRRDARGPLDRRPRPRARRRPRRPARSPSCARRAPSSCRSPPRPGCPGSTCPTGVSPQGRRLGRRRVGRDTGRARRRRPRATPSTAISATGGTPLVVAERRRTSRSPHAGRRPPQGLVKPGMRERFDRAARDGHPHRDDHRRQPAAPPRPSRPRPASTTSSPRPRPRTRWP